MMVLAEITEAPENPKRHALSDIQLSYEKHGAVEVPVLDERTGRLVAGHGRIEALRGLHNTKSDPPRGIQVGQGGQWLVPVLRGWASENDNEAKSYLLASNRLSEKGGWEDLGLAKFMQDFVDENGPRGLEGTGFTVPDLDELLKANADAILELNPETPAFEPETTTEAEPARNAVLVSFASQNEAAEFLAEQLEAGLDAKMAGNVSHGLSGRPEYDAWQTMRQRCLNPKSKDFHHYGARGITVCDRWASFENFMADMGPRPEGHSLDRVSNDSGYGPENCKWSSAKEQAANRRPRRTNAQLIAAGEREG